MEAEAHWPKTHPADPTAPTDRAECARYAIGPERENGIAVRARQIPRHGLTVSAI